METILSLSTALSWNHNWDPIHSLNLTQEFNIQSCQVYINNNFSDDKIEEIKKYNLNYIYHSPSSIEDEALNKEEIEVVKKLANGKDVYVVYHHDLKVPVDKSLDIIKSLNKEGITVLLENFYASRDQHDVRENIESYKRLIIEAHFNNLKLIPLLDIPRLFIEGINSILNPYDETISLINLINSLGSTLYLHLIDAKNDTQSRESWCAIGEGYIPYKKIFNYLKKSKIKIPMIVLEYEDEKHINGSIKNLEEMFANIHR